MSKDQLSTMSFDRRRVLQGIAGGFAAAGSTTLFAPAVRAANKPIKIGYVSPKSGPLAAFAEADRSRLAALANPAPASGTHGPVALAAPDAWRPSAAGITAHVAEIGNIPRLANSARRNLGAIVEPLRTHAVHVYAGRLQRLSVDGDGSTLAWEACVERTETWLREGPKDAAPPQRRKDKAA